MFVAKSLSLLEGEAPEVEEKAWNREETTWSLHGASVTCNGRGCTICNGESCESFVLASEAFRYFLSNLGVAGGQATFKGDRARAYASMEADLNLDEEFALDSGSQVNLCSPRAARRYFMNKRAANLKIVGVAGSQSATSAGDLELTVVDENGLRFGLNCGVAFSLEKTPLNLLSVSALMKQGTVITSKMATVG